MPVSEKQSFRNPAPQGRYDRNIVFLQALVWLVVVMLVTTIGPVRAADPGQSSNPPASHGPETGEPPTKTLQVENCRICHQNPGMRPTYVGSDGILHDLYVDQRRFERSTHYIMAGKYYCTDCHQTGFGVYPHEKQKPLGCIHCHAKALLKEKFLAIKVSFQQSVHYDAEQVAFECNTCHPVHYARKSRRMTLAEKKAMCAKCHEDRHNLTGISLLEQHQWHPKAQLHLERTACIACHTQPDQWEESFTFKHRVLPKEAASGDCDDCHSAGGKLADYLVDIGENPLQLSNAQLAGNFYVSGATRIVWLDTLGLLLLLATAIGVFMHGLIRLGAAVVRRKP
uniref:Doubled CXXCH domain-containing protein n=1 Tax=Candidatus Kentrum eta TaxID=2126337 RepID=A0A450UMX8_9GAMM|nr:MAG: doubled CXXCH domain-containing protein [Candidatus Kentron sp. H]VFJ93881.1 MAG: doubled CXXCH domain-containing protein [Candidatus Kentron sp. H]VFK00391.1 MAG: doubled CXXCH domain-containing protein [Candidatus Kentron sp. H]